MSPHDLSIHVIIGAKPDCQPFCQLTSLGNMFLSHGKESSAAPFILKFQKQRSRRRILPVEFDYLP